MESHHLSCSALSEGRGRGGRDTRTGGKAGPRLKADQKNSSFSLTLIWSGLRQLGRGAAEIVSLILHVSGCCVATSVTILVRWDLPVSQWLFTEHQKTSQWDWLPPSVGTATLRMAPFHPPRACDCKWGGYQQTNKQTSKRGERDSKGFFRGAHTFLFMHRSALFDLQMCFSNSWWCLQRWLQTGVWKAFCCLFHVCVTVVFSLLPPASPPLTCESPISS